VQFAVACHSEVAMQLGAVWAAVSSTTQSMLGRLPVEFFKVDILGGDGCQVLGAVEAVLACCELWLQNL
jgi:hypothetical protein